MLEIDANFSKGTLSQVRDKLVNNHAQTQIAEQIGLDHYLNINKNTALSKKALADCLEAIIGAIFLDSKRNYLITKRFVIQQWSLQDYYTNFLARALQSQDVEKVDYLLNCGADANANLLLMVEENKGKKDELVFFVTREHRSLISIPTTPLLFSETPAIVEILLKRGIDVNQRNLLGMTAFYNAACRGDIEIARILRRYGAEFISCDGDNYSPLHVATYYGRLEMVEFLLQEGISANCSDTNGQTALHVAANCNLPKIAECLLKYSANVNEMPVKTLLSIDNHFIESEVLVEECGSPLHIYESPLHTAAFNNRIRMIKILHDYQANLNIQNQAGRTPLHYASANNHYLVVKQLIRYQADINIIDEDGCKAIDLAKDDNIKELLTENNVCTIKTSLQNNSQRFFSGVKDSQPLIIISPKKGQLEFKNNNCSENNLTWSRRVKCSIL